MPALCSTSRDMRSSVTQSVDVDVAALAPLEQRLNPRAALEAGPAHGRVRENLDQLPSALIVEGRSQIHLGLDRDLVLVVGRIACVKQYILRHGQYLGMSKWLSVEV